MFVNYAHRGASEYVPENTFLAFNLGIYMGANGIETDVQITKDGIAVLFHDDTLVRMTGHEGKISDYDYEQLCQFDVRKGDLTDKIPTLKDFIDHFGYRDIIFAIELKQRGTAKLTADILRSCDMAHKTVVTSFMFDEICDMRSYAPEFKIGYLTNNINDDLLDNMKRWDMDEICPEARIITPDLVSKLHGMGFNVRAWGVYNTELMKQAYDAGCDGMTVNFPDKLKEYIDTSK